MFGKVGRDLKSLGTTELDSCFRAELGFPNALNSGHTFSMILGVK